MSAGDVYPSMPTLHDAHAASTTQNRRRVARAALIVALSMATPALANSLDVQLVKRVITRQHASLRACYEATLQTQPEAAGRIIVKFSVASDGRVTEATATGMDESLCVCVAGVFRGLVFPKSPSLIHISYPLSFATPPPPPKKQRA